MAEGVARLSPPGTFCPPENADSTLITSARSRNHHSSDSTNITPYAATVANFGASERGMPDKECVGVRWVIV